MSPTTQVLKSLRANPTKLFVFSFISIAVIKASLMMPHLGVFLASLSVLLIQYLSISDNSMDFVRSASGFVRKNFFVLFFMSLFLSPVGIILGSAKNLLDTGIEYQTVLPIAWILCLISGYFYLVLSAGFFRFTASGVEPFKSIDVILAGSFKKIYLTLQHCFFLSIIFLLPLWISQILWLALGPLVLPIVDNYQVQLNSIEK